MSSWWKKNSFRG